MIINSRKHLYKCYSQSEINVNNKTTLFANYFYSNEFKLNDLYDKTVIIICDFGYKHDYMMTLINELVNDNSRVITLDLVGHNTMSNFYRKITYDVAGIGSYFSEENKNWDEFQLKDDFIINDKYKNSSQEYYDFLNNDFSNLMYVINDYKLNENNEGKKLFIVSHSLGSLSVFCNLYSSLGSWNNESENFITGVVSLSLNIKDLRFENRFLFNIAKFLWPGKLLTYDLKLKNDFEKMIGNDFKKKCTVRAISSILNLQYFINQKADMITVPNLFFHAKDDEISSYDDSLKFFSNLKSSKKEFITYTEGGHNLFLGNKSYEVIDKIKSWMSELI